MGYQYAGARKKIAVREILAMQRHGFGAQEKHDGCYCVLGISAGPGWRGERELGRVGALWYRSGRLVGHDTGRDVLGLQTGWAPGTVAVGELMVSTPAAARWQDREGCAGIVLFDVLRVGSWDVGRDARVPAWRDTSRLPFAERYRELQWLVGELPAKARKAIRLAEVRKAGLRNWYAEIVERGGEGLVLADPHAPLGARGAKVKVKRADETTCRVARLLPDEGLIMLTLAGVPEFAVTSPSFEVAAGDLIDVAHTGVYESGIPRHARIVRTRSDLAGLTGRAP